MLYSKNTGYQRLHPQDTHVQRGIGFASPTGGDVKLDRVVNAPDVKRRVEREDAPALKARLKRESRHAGRSARKRASRKAAATIG